MPPLRVYIHVDEIVCVFRFSNGAVWQDAIAFLRGFTPRGGQALPAWVKDMSTSIVLRDDMKSGLLDPAVEIQTCVDDRADVYAERGPPVLDSRARATGEGASSDDAADDAGDTARAAAAAPVDVASGFSGVEIVGASTEVGVSGQVSAMGGETDGEEKAAVAEHAYSAELGRRQGDAGEEKTGTVEGADDGMEEAQTPPMTEEGGGGSLPSLPSEANEFPIDEPAPSSLAAAREPRRAATAEEQRRAAGGVAGVLP